MLARVKQDYAAGSVMAFSGHEYVRSEWRQVPAGFEEQAKSHPLLDVQLSTDEIRRDAPLMPGLGNPEPEPATPETPPAVTVETEAPQAAVEPAATEPQPETKPAETEPESKTARRRPRAAKD